MSVLNFSSGPGRSVEGVPDPHPVAVVSHETPRYGDWIQLFSGKRFWPLDPRPEDILLEDIAHALSNVCRFTGHVREFYSVAQHSVFVSHRVPEEHALWGLLHDASEAYVCDVARPVKRQREMTHYRLAEKEIMRAVCQRFGLPEVEPAAVKLADNRALYTEARDLLPVIAPEWTWHAEPYDVRVGGLPPATAKRLFLARFAALTGGAT